MIGTKQAIELAKKKSGSVSYYELSKTLGITQGAISHYRKGDRALDGETALKVAALAEIDATELLAVCESERAKDKTLKNAWLTLAKMAKNHQAAAVILSAPVLALTLAAKGFAAVSTAAQCILCEMALTNRRA